MFRGCFLHANCKNMRQTMEIAHYVTYFASPKLYNSSFLSSGAFTKWVRVFNVMFLNESKRSKASVSKRLFFKEVRSKQRHPTIWATCRQTLPITASLPITIWIRHQMSAVAWPLLGTPQSSSVRFEDTRCDNVHACEFCTRLTVKSKGKVAMILANFHVGPHLR